MDANAVVLIDAAGIVRAVQLAPEQPLTAPQILSLVDTTLHT